MFGLLLNSPTAAAIGGPGGPVTPVSTKATQRIALNYDSLQFGPDVTKRVTFESDAQDARVLTVGTTEETFVLSSEIDNAGKLYVQNLNPAQFVDMGFSTGVYPMRLEPKDHAQIPLSPATKTLYVKADAAPANVLFFGTSRITSIE